MDSQKTSQELSQELLFYLQELKKYSDMNDNERAEVLKQVKSLIKDGADVNEKNSFEKTPLNYAAENGRKETVEYLIDNGADLNAQNKFGHTPLYLAAIAGKKEIVKLLIQHDFRIDDDVIAEYEEALNNCKNEEIKSILEQEIIVHQELLSIKQNKNLINELFNLI